MMAKRHTSKQIIKVLKANGFLEKKNNGGSHRKFYNPVTNRTTVVPIHSLGDEVRIGTETAIFKEAGLKKEDIRWK